MTRAQAKKEVKRFAKKYGVRLIFSRNLRCHGWATLKDEFVTLRNNQSISNLFSTAAHEICHILNKREGKYPIYHDWRQWREDGDFSSEFLATSHRAELYTDKRGKALLKLNYPHLKFIFGYKNTQKSKIGLRKSLNPKEDWE
jgi:hypothetical protein